MSGFNSPEVDMGKELSAQYLTLSNTNLTSSATQVYPRSWIILIIVDLDKKRELEDSIRELTDQVRQLEEMFRKSQNEEDQLHNRLQDLENERKALADEMKAIRQLYTDLESNKTRLAQQQAKKKTEEERADTTEADLARVEEQRQQTVMERVEHALTLEVSPPLACY